MSILRSCFATLLLVTASLAQGADVGGSVKLSDSAQTKILKLPIVGPTETAAKFGTKFTVVFNAPGIDPALFNADSTFEIKLVETGDSGTDYSFKFRLGDDPKYVAGGKSAKIARKAPGATGGFGIASTSALKFGKTGITVTVSDNLVPAYSFSFINNSVKGSANLPAGPGTGTVKTDITATFGDQTLAIGNVTYTAKYNNKSNDFDGKILWSGTSKGSLTATK